VDVLHEKSKIPHWGMHSTRLWTVWWMNCDLNAVGARDFPLLQNIQTSSGAHPAS